MLVRIILFLALSAVAAHGCPELAGIPNTTCLATGTKIVAVGDSITFGRGDQLELGGYPGRLAMILGLPIVKVARPGATTNYLYSYILRPRNLEKLQGTSLAILLIGVNDYFLGGVPGAGVPAQTVTNIKRIATRLRVRAGVGQVVVGTLLKSKRDYQNVFISAVNARIDKLEYNKISFHKLNPEKVISIDRLHPHARGYQYMANLVANYIVRRFSPASRAIFTDNDTDGIYGSFESSTFNTDPSNPDTDGDGLLDGAEVFTYGTSPLLTDSNNNGISDFDEIFGGPV